MKHIVALEICYIHTVFKKCYYYYGNILHVLGHYSGCCAIKCGVVVNSTYGLGPLMGSQDKSEGSKYD